MNSSYLILIGVVFLGFVLLLGKKSKKSVSGEVDEWPFYSKKPLSDVEQILYHRIVKALPDHIILAQVSLSRFLGVKKGNKFNVWFNKINRLTADYVVCSKSFDILGVIELDDKSHERAKNKANDNKKDKALHSAGIKVVRWHVKTMPDDATIQAMFEEKGAVLLANTNVQSDT